MCLALELKTGNRIFRNIVVDGGTTHSNQVGALSRCDERTFISLFRRKRLLLLSLHMLFSASIFIGMFGTSLATIPRCAFAGDEGRMTPLANILNFNSTAHISAVISVKTI